MNARVAPTVSSYASSSCEWCIDAPANPVRNEPGSGISTRIPCGATSAASASVRPSSANFAAQ